MRLPGKKRSRILTEPISFNYFDSSSWDSIIDQLLNQMSRFITAIEPAAPGNGAPIRTTIIRKAETYLPPKVDVELAANQIFYATGGDIDAILDQVEKNAIGKGKNLKTNWRMITERNIAIWFK